MKRFRLDMAQAVRDLLIHLPPPLKRKVKAAYTHWQQIPTKRKP